MATTYGLLSQDCIEDLRKYHTVEDINNSGDLKDLLKILRTEKRLPKSTVLTAQDVIDNKEFLLELTNKTVSYITFNFIPILLDIFKSDIANKFPDTSSLTAVLMELSEEGKERWQEAITEHIEFTPFKEFEQLIPFMTPPQKELWDSILKRRPIALAIAAIDVNFENKQTKEEVEAHKTQLLAEIDGMNTNSGLIQKTIKKKKNIMEQSAHDRIKEIESAEAMVQELAIETQSQHQMQSPQTQELAQQHLNEEPNNDNEITEQQDTPLGMASEEALEETPEPPILEDAKTKLINIVSILIKNISEGAGGRYTSSTQHKKVTDLKSILNRLTNSDESGTIQDDWVKEIMDVCKIKRNSLHFWAVPHSVVEFKGLLKDNNIMLPSEHQSNSFK
ncbi:hypothetical protein Lmor_2769 [Legionella moravica]|uniref:Uncharacterized protein n=1 Tax=Legionella moravica TaxID=39962 RepID=A0A378JXD9_9GAMM|nr:hypothetical protein [Legionella moravica]KTD31162.1 hypothetical protein Lmor_2769 [Legionella moravica]STX63214.1 Uncharacterised protein [Legionella moravica]